MDKYKGEGDPAEHVQNYYEMMTVLHVPEETICRCFPITLTGSAKLWWNGLPKRSIGSFEQLNQKFVHHFLANTKRKLPRHALIQMRQEPRESLWDYIKRFQKKRLEVEDPGSRVAMAAIIAGLLDNELADSLAKKQYTTYEQMMAKAHGYMDMEDARAYKAVARAAEATAAVVLAAAAPTTSTAITPASVAPAAPAIPPIVIATPTPEPERKSAVDPPSRHEPTMNLPKADYRPSQNDRRERRREPPPRLVLTALNTSLTEALPLAQKDGLLTSPPPVMRSNPRNRDTRQYCRYYKDQAILPTSAESSGEILKI